MYIAHSVSHETVLVARWRESGVYCNCLTVYFLACFSTASTKNCSVINTRLLINQGKFLLNAELSPRQHLLWANFLVSSWCCGPHVVWLWLVCGLCVVDKGNRIAYHLLSKSVEFSAIQIYSKTFFLFEWLGFLFCLFAPQLHFECMRGTGSAKKGVVMTWSCRMKHSRYSSGGYADKAVFFHFEVRILLAVTGQKQPRKLE